MMSVVGLLAFNFARGPARVRQGHVPRHRRHLRAADHHAQHRGRSWARSPWASSTIRGARTCSSPPWGSGSPRPPRRPPPTSPWPASPCSSWVPRRSASSPCARPPSSCTARAPIRGRIMALWVFVYLGTTPIGSILTGWIISAGGPRGAPGRFGGLPGRGGPGRLRPHAAQSRRRAHGPGVATAR